ncbi:MAG TPA: hypothetical protein VMS17_29760 [Gemmataceae bacterium]|nr:hypothetical protein [Gemmataceae bacterium]
MGFFFERPIYLLLGLMAVAAVALWVQVKVWQWLAGRRTGDAPPIPPEERPDMAPLWMDDRWATDVREHGDPAFPGDKASDERITPG